MGLFDASEIMISAMVFAFGYRAISFVVGLSPLPS